MTPWDWVKVILVVTAVIAATEIVGIRLGHAGAQTTMKAGITILPSGTAPDKSGAKASSASAASTPKLCPQQDSNGTINLQGQAWSC